MNLSKSKYCLGYQCEKILWLDKYKSEYRLDNDNQAVLDNGTDVGIIAQDLFGKHKVVEFNKDLSKMIDDTKRYLMEENIVLCEASIKYNNNFCSVDILKKNKDKYEIYEVKSSTHCKDIFVEDASYQYFVLKSAGYNVKKVCVVTLNSDYIRHGDLELDKLFKINDITDVAIDKFSSVKKKIEEINKYMAMDMEEEKKLGTYCFSPYECPYFNYCSRNLVKNNIFDIKGMQLKSKINLYNQGYISFEDLLNANINQKVRQQIEFEINNLKPYVNKDNIKEFLNTLSYPIYYLDFESYQEAIPEFDNARPYMQMPFQYSLHYQLKEDKELMHTEFLAEGSGDPRRNLALSLVKDIPQDVCVVAYNMAFEKMIIKHLASLYPDLRKHLLNISDNMKDLIIPFRNRDFYVKEMQGKSSIKYVLPALFPNDPSLNYHNLDLVHKGDEASNAFKSMKNLSKEEVELLRAALLKYCELDTFAMVKIHQKLKSVVEK